MPLSDARVLDLSQAVAGPVVGAFLGDLGADVIKIERPTGDAYRINRRELNGEGFNPPFELYNRNKRGVCINLKREEGREVFYDLVEISDIVIQNWPPGVDAALEVDYETLSARNEDLIYVHITGYGETGPDAKNPAMDAIIQHVSGFSSLLGYEDTRPPIRSQSSLADFYAGYNATISALAALRYRDQGGGGQKIDVSLLESMMHCMDGAFEYYNNLGEPLQRGGRSGFFAPDMLYGAARAKDGWICVALLVYMDRVWEGYCELLDRSDLYDNPAYQTDDGRVADAGYLTDLFETWLADQPADEAIEQLNDHGIPAGPHHTVADAAHTDQVQARNVFTEVSHPKYSQVTLTDTPLDLSAVDTTVQAAAPVLGEHNEDVLSDIGRTHAEISDLEDQGVLHTE